MYVYISAYHMAEPRSLKVIVPGATSFAVKFWLKLVIHWP